ncbi:unnamed protein product, partial [Rotaria socialis]
LVKYADEVVKVEFVFDFNSTNSSKCDLSDKNLSLDVLFKHMTQKSSEIRSVVSIEWHQ